MAGTGVKCKKCGAKFRVVFGTNPRMVSQVLERDCGYKLSLGDEPDPKLSNIICSACGGKEFEQLPLEEKVELQREWVIKVVEFEKKHPGLEKQLVDVDFRILRTKMEKIENERDRGAPVDNSEKMSLEKFDDIDKELIRKAAAEPDRWNPEGQRTIKGIILKVNPKFKEVDILDERLRLPCIVDVPEEKIGLLDKITAGERWELQVAVFTAEPAQEFKQIAREIGLDDAVKAAGAEKGLDKLYRFVLVGCKKTS